MQFKLFFIQRKRENEQKMTLFYCQGIRRKKSNLSFLFSIAFKHKLWRKVKQRIRHFYKLKDKKLSHADSECEATLSKIDTKDQSMKV